MTPIYTSWPVGADSGGAVAVNNTDVLVKYTYFGDADLDGTVDNSNDYLLWLNGYSNHLTGWLNGDFDYSGAVDNSSDYLLWLNALANQGSSASRQRRAAGARAQHAGAGRAGFS